MDGTTVRTINLTIEVVEDITIAPGGGDGGNSSGGSTGGGIFYRGNSYSNTDRSASTPTVISQGTFTALSSEAALEAVQKAIAASGSSENATVSVNNIGEVTRAIFQSMRELAQQAGKTSLLFQANSLTADRTAVAVRITLDVFSNTRNLNLSASIDSTQVLRTKNSFEK